VRTAGGALTLTLLLAACASSEERSASEVRAAKRAEVHAQLGASYLQRNQLDVALQELEQALAADPADSQANNVMGLLQVRLQNDALAEQHFLRAIEARPANPEAQNNYGVFLCERDRLDEAEAQFRAALANPLYKTPELANVNAGACLLKRSDPRRAAAYFKAALQLNPKSPLALASMARISFEAGEHLSARGFLQRHLEVAKETAEILLLAARIEQALGARDAQARYATRLRTRYPDSPEAKQLPALTGG
jgi:type IV pilus assembly protein PilF